MISCGRLRMWGFRAVLGFNVSPKVNNNPHGPTTLCVQVRARFVERFSMGTGGEAGNQSFRGLDDKVSWVEKFVRVGASGMEAAHDEYNRQAPRLRPRIAPLYSSHSTVAAPVLESEAASKSALERSQKLEGHRTFAGRPQSCDGIVCWRPIKDQPGRLCPATPESTLRASLTALVLPQALVSPSQPCMTQHLQTHTRSPSEISLPRLDVTTCRIVEQL